MKIGVKDAIADIFLQEGVEYVFGQTGGQILQMWKAANNAGLKLIINKQEGNAVYMADSYTRISKKTGVVLGTVGPGAVNMLTGLATAYLDSIPLIAIGGSNETNMLGKNPIQDCSARGRAVDQKLAFKAVCKQAILAQNPESIPDIVREAFRVALSGRPGPVYIEIPSDYWDMEIDYEVVSKDKYKNLNIPSCNESDCKKIETALFDSKMPLVIIGEGAEEKGTKEKLKKILNSLQIPFAVSPLAKNYVDNHDPLYLGVMRAAGKTQKVYEYMRQADFVLFLGDRMQEWEINWGDESLLKGKLLAQVDMDAEEIGKVYPVSYSALGSISSFISIIEKKEHKNSKKLLEIVNSLNTKFPRLDNYNDSDKGINPLNIISIVEKYSSNDATIVCDTGSVKSLTILKYRLKENQNFVTADNYGPMGYSVPASLGASLANKKEVVCFVGDGGFQMSSNELGLLLNYDLKVIYLVHNNSGCGSIRRYHSSIYGHHCAADFINPDYVKLAESYGMNGYRVNNKTDFEKAFLKAQKSNKSTIIDIVVDDSITIWE